MADPVEISNVGGYRGVASEATLLALVDSIRRQGGGVAGDRSVSRLQELHNRSIREGTREVKLFDKAIEKAAEATSDFTKELLVGGDRISDFADAILGSQNVLARFIGFVQGTFDQFRNLTSVGASFNNSMIEMITTSSEASMTIDGFAEMVRDNSRALTSFGGTVTQGAQYFARFSRDFRLGVGQRFFEMGFTVADINEGLIGFLEMERMRSSRALRSDAELQAGAANYLLQLDRLSKVTGRQRRDLEEVMKRQLQDAGIRAQMNRLDGQAQENFRDVLTFMQTELPGLSDGLIDLMDGVAQTDLGRALQSQLPGITGFMQEAFAGGASLEEFMDMLANRYGPQLDGLANSFSAAQLQQMRMAGGIQGAIAEMIDAGYEVNRAVSRDTRAARAEQAANADILTRTFGRFEQAIIEMRKFLFNSLLRSPFAEAIGELGDSIMDLFEGKGSGTFQGAIDVMGSGFDFLFGDNGILTRAVKWFSNWIRTGGIKETFEKLKTTIDEFVTRFTANMEAEGFWRAIGLEIERIISNLFGAVDDQGNRTGGLIDRLFEGFVSSEFWQDFKTNFFDIVFNDANAQREGEDFFDTIKRLIIDKLVGRPDAGVDLSTAISNRLKDLFLGPISEIIFQNGEETEVRRGGLLDQITQWLFNDENLNRGDFMTKVSEFAGDALSGTIQAFTTLLESSQPLIDAISNGFTSILNIASGAISNWISTNLSLPESSTTGSTDFWNRVYQKILDVISGSANTIDLTSALTQRLTTVIESMVALPEADNQGSNSLWNRITQRILDAISGEQGTETMSAAIRTRILNLIGAEQTGLNLYEDILNYIGLVGNQGEGILIRIEKALGIHSTQIAGDNLWERMYNKMNENLFNPESGLIPVLIQGFKDMMEDVTVIQNLKDAMTNLLNTVSTSFQNYWQGEEGKKLYDTIVNFFDDMWLRLLMYIDEATGLIDDESILNRRFEQFTRSIDTSDGLSSEERTAISDQIALLDMQKDRYDGWLWDDEEMAVIENQIATLQGLLDQNSFAQGTNGFQNFDSKGTPAMLHGVEAVVPRNTPAGELLQAFYDMQSGSQAQTTQTTSTQPTYNQSELASKIDQLNSIMTQVAGILLDQKDIQNRTMRSLRGMGTDLFKGAA